MTVERNPEADVLMKSCRISDSFSLVAVVAGGWSSWSSWSDCSSECDSGVQTRERFCSSPPPLYRGLVCPGPHIQTRDCNVQPCSGTWCHCKPLADVCQCVFLKWNFVVQVCVRRAWHSCRRISARLRAARVLVCVWTPWRMWSVPLSVMMDVTVLLASICSITRVCRSTAAPVTIRGRCTHRATVCLMTAATTGNFLFPHCLESVVRNHKIDQ